jgi:hypothetical protein
MMRSTSILTCVIFTIVCLIGGVPKIGAAGEYTSVVTEATLATSLSKETMGFMNTVLRKIIRKSAAEQQRSSYQKDTVTRKVTEKIIKKTRRDHQSAFNPNKTREYIAGTIFVLAIIVAILSKQKLAWFDNAFLIAVPVLLTVFLLWNIRHDTHLFQLLKYNRINRSEFAEPDARKHPFDLAAQSIINATWFIYAMFLLFSPAAFPEMKTAMKISLGFFVLLHGYVYFHLCKFAINENNMPRLSTKRLHRNLMLISQIMMTAAIVIALKLALWQDLTTAPAVVYLTTLFALLFISIGLTQFLRNYYHTMDNTWNDMTATKRLWYIAIHPDEIDSYDDIPFYQELISCAQAGLINPLHDVLRSNFYSYEHKRDTLAAIFFEGTPDLIAHTLLLGDEFLRSSYNFTEAAMKIPKHELQNDPDALLDKILQHRQEYEKMIKTGFNSLISIKARKVCKRLLKEKQFVTNAKKALKDIDALARYQKSIEKSSIMISPKLPDLDRLFGPQPNITREERRFFAAA